MSYTTLFFDLDGTLIDFGKAAENSFYHTFKEYGIDATKEMLEAYHKINEKCWVSYEGGEITKDQLLKIRFATLFERYSINLEPMEFNQKFLDNLSLEVYLVDGAVPLLDKLSGKFKIVAVTNGVSRTQHMRLTKGNLIKYFDEIIVSEDAGAAKPNKAFFDYAFSKLPNVNPSEVILIGDSLSADITGGVSYGLDCCFYSPNGVTAPEEIAPKYTISHLSEVLTIVMPEDNKYNNIRDCYLNNNYNCAETMMLALSKENGLNLPIEALRAISAFGGGMATGETCGALAGLMAIAGMSTVEAKAHESNELKSQCQEIMKLWQETFGTIRCCEIKPRYLQKGQRCVGTCENAYDIYQKAINKLQGVEI